MKKTSGRDELIVFIRIILYGLGGLLAGGGLIGEETELFFRDPQFAAEVAGIVIYVGTTLWYVFSKARRALRGKIDEVDSQDTDWRPAGQSSGHSRQEGGGGDRA